MYVFASTYVRVRVCTYWYVFVSVHECTRAYKYV
jgi:hypothetical protein